MLTSASAVIWEHHAKIPPFQKKRIERKQTEDGEGKLKRKYGRIVKRRRKESGGQREGRKSRQRKIHKADMVNRKNTEVQGKCKVAKKNGKDRKK